MRVACTCVCMGGVQCLAHKSLLFIWHLACPHSQPRGVCNDWCFESAPGPWAGTRDVPPHGPSRH